MKRRVLNLLTALSLLLCAAVLYSLGSAWIGGEYHTRPRYIGRTPYMLVADRGGVGVIWFSPSRPGGLTVRLPYAVAVPAVALLPALAGLRSRREALGRRRTRSGLCPACGYDLRASPGRCPECGYAAAGNAAPGEVTGKGDTVA